jgi:hypothetical protein
MKHAKFAAAMMVSTASAVMSSANAATCAWLGDDPDASTHTPLLERFVVRNRFDKTYNQNAPAVFSFQQGSSGSSSLVNIGIKAPETECYPFGGGTLLGFSPVIEYARNSDRDNKINRWKVGLDAYIAPDISRYIDLPLVFSARVARDQEKQVTTGNGSLLLAPRPKWEAVAPWFHTVWVGAGNGVFWDFRPYFGVEEYGHVSTADGTHDLTYSLTKVYAELWPMRHLPLERLQLTAEYEYRHQVDGRTPPLTNVRLLSAGATYYLDAEESFGLGISYSKGEDPDSDFVRDEITQVALKVKYGK